MRQGLGWRGIEDEDEDEEELRKPKGQGIEDDKVEKKAERWVRVAGLRVAMACLVWLGVGQIELLGSEHLPNAAAHIGTITINHNEQFTTNLAVTLELQAVDGGSGVVRMQFSNDNETWSEPEPYQATKNWLLVDDGQYPPKMNTVLKTVLVRFQDGASGWSRAVSDSIVLAKTALDVPQIKEVWIAQQPPADYASGDPLGSQRNPYLIPAGANEVQFDGLMNSLMTNYGLYLPQPHWTTNLPGPATNATVLTIHIGPGIYETHGDNEAHGKTRYWKPRNGWRIFGAGKDVTVFKAVDLRLGYWARVNVIGGGGVDGDYGNLEIEDLTLDANIHEGGTNMTGQFSQGMMFHGSNIQIRRVKVKNSGSHMAGAEPGAINLQAFGSEFDNYNLILEDCEVGQTQFGNAYNPNLIAVSGEFGADGKMRYYRNVLIRNCYCDGAAFDGEVPINPTQYAHNERANQAFGVGGTWGAVIEDNYAFGVMAGYYVDSPTLHDLVVRNNHFRTVLAGAQMTLQSTPATSLRLEDFFRFERNLVELDPLFYANGDNRGSYGCRYPFLLFGNVKGPVDYSLRRLILTNNTFQFTDQRQPDLNVFGVRGVLRGVKTAEVGGNSYLGIARPLTWDNDVQCLDSQVDIVDGRLSAPVVCVSNRLGDGTVVEAYPYVLDKNLPRVTVVEGQEVGLAAPDLGGVVAAVADGLPVANALGNDGVFRWKTTAQDAGRYLVGFYESSARRKDPRRTLVTVLDRVPANDSHSFANGLKAYWRFDESNGSTLADSSGNRLSLDASRIGALGLATLGAPGYTAEKNALHLNARSVANAELLQVPNLPGQLFSGHSVLFHPLLDRGASLFHPFSISFWYKLDSKPQQNQVIFNQNGDSSWFYCAVTPGTNSADQKAGVIFGTLDANVTTATPVVYPVGTWYQVTLVYDGVSTRVYVNGVKSAEQVCGQITGFTSVSSFTLGGGFGWGGFVGSLADLAIWDRPLSDTEIGQFYSRQAAGVAPVLTPVAPSGLSAQLVSGSSATIRWQDNSSNEGGFVVERGVGGADFTAVASLAADVASYTDTLPTAGGSYYYRVRATNSFGGSEYSNLAAVGVPSLPVPGGMRVIQVSTK